MELAELRTNNGLKESGAKLKVEGVTITVRSIKSKIVIKKLEELQEPNKGRIQRNTVSDEEQTELSRRLFAESVIVDWEGIKLDGKEFKFSVKNAMHLLTEYEILADAIAAFAGDIGNFLDSKVEKAVEKLKKS